MAASTFRQDIVTGLVAILDGFIAANPTLLRRSYAVRPPHFNTDLPLGFVGPRPETATHVQGLRTRTLSPTITLVDRLTDSTESMRRMDVLVDAFADYLTANPHIRPGTIWEDWTVADEQIEVGDGTILIAATFTVGDVSIMEPRT